MTKTISVHTDIENLILFDGVCNLCNGAVNFIIDRDPNARFKFASLQSDIGQAVLNELGHSTTEFDTMMLVKNGAVSSRSTAALKIAKGLNGLWPIFYALIIIPPFIRNFFYNLVSKYRYKIFGKSDQCLLPTPELKSRFIQ
ncbi:MAG: DCC1-like thiol-disulfide oxidoreductase family protein [Cyclobacteriaceae bacterium]